MIKWIAGAAAAACAVAAALVLVRPCVGDDDQRSQTRESPWTDEVEPLPAEIETALSDGLADYVIALDGWMRALRGPGSAADAEDELELSRADLLSEDVSGALGPEATDRLRTVLDRTREAGAISREELPDAAGSLGDAVIALNDAFARAGIAYMVDHDVTTSRTDRSVYLASFRVEEVRVYRSGETVVKVLHLRRLDQLNWTYVLAGFTSRNRSEVLVLLEQVDEVLVRRVLPQLADDPPPFYHLDEEVADASWVAPLQSRIGELVRREYGGDPATERLGDLLGRRRDLVDRWNERLEPYGVALDPPGKLHLPPSIFHEVASAPDVFPAEEVEDLRAIEEALAAPELERALERARTPLLAAVDRHEVQHRLDDLRREPLPMPEPLRAFVGPKHDDDGRERTGATGALAELSAYLAELARDPDTPQVGLAIVGQYLVEERHWGMGESFAAAVIFEGLIEELDLPGSRELVRGGAVDRTRVSEVVRALTDMPVERIQRAARSLWERLFEDELPPLAAGVQ